MFQKVLIANRGEIACRIIKTTRRMGIESVAIYSTADSDAPHVGLADHAFCVGQPASAVSYLNIDTIIKIAVACGAEAIHPGYGFLSENPQFAKACEKAGIVFVGPSIYAMEAMASKQLAKQLLEKTKVPVTPGYHGQEQANERLIKEAQLIGFPVLLKAACGGGGKGMREVHSVSEFDQALAGARREALAYFADDTILIEKLILRPRHVEMQIMADNHGNIVHLFERDCSIQRRHQKIIEEAPAPNLPSNLREGLAKAAIEVARAIDYRGAGTVEFLVDQEKRFYFMEMNTRLQVEHPVTEMITGLDLVEWQLRIAADEHLPCTQESIQQKGHAIECRIYAEDPEKNFIPSIGEIRFLKEPDATNIRIDSGISLKSQVSMYYDPMIAKLIAWGESRTVALQRLQYALKNYHIGGVKTNIPFLQCILKQPSFANADLSTDFLSQALIPLPTVEEARALFLAASVDYLKIVPKGDALRAEAFSWQMHLQGHWTYRYVLHAQPHDIIVKPIDHESVMFQHLDESIALKIKITEDKLYVDDGQQCQTVFFEEHDDILTFYTEHEVINIERVHDQTFSSVHNAIDARLTAPMPATIVAILKTKGDQIVAGDPLIVLEAMKMEHTIHAPHDGFLTQVFYNIGDQVQEGSELVSLDKNKSNPS